MRKYIRNFFNKHEFFAGAFVFFIFSVLLGLFFQGISYTFSYIGEYRRDKERGVIERQETIKKTKVNQIILEMSAKYNANIIDSIDIVPDVNDKRNVYTIDFQRILMKSSPIVIEVEFIDLFVQFGKSYACFSSTWQEIYFVLECDSTQIDKLLSKKPKERSDDYVIVTNVLFVQK